MQRIRKYWDKAVLVSLLGIVAITIAHFAFHFSHEQVFVLEILDMVFLSILAVDVFQKFKKAHDKIKFLKTSWVEIIVLLPIGAFFEFLRFSEFLRFGELLEFTRLFRVAQAGVHVKELSGFLPFAFLLSFFKPKAHPSEAAKGKGRKKRKRRKKKRKTFPHRG